MLVRFLKNWTLPLAMLSGTLGYFILANVPFLAPTKPYINDLIAYITPTADLCPTVAYFL